MLQAEEVARTYLAAVAGEAMQAMGSIHTFAQALGAHPDHSPHEDTHGGYSKPQSVCVWSVFV